MTTTKEQAMDDLTPPHWGARTDLEDQLGAASADAARWKAAHVSATRLIEEKEATIAQQGEELARLREALSEAIDAIWLASMEAPHTEGDGQAAEQAVAGYRQALESPKQ